MGVVFRDCHFVVCLMSEEFAILLAHHRGVIVVHLFEITFSK
jgi:hypothetical protein